MKLKSLLSIFTFLFLFSCSKSEININQEQKPTIVGSWKVVELSYSETTVSTVSSIASINKNNSVANNSSLVYTFSENPNELTSEGFFDIETTYDNGKSDTSVDIKGIDGIYTPTSWILENNKIMLEYEEFTQEIEIKELTESTLKLYYIFTRETVNTLSSDTTKKTIIYNLTLERV